MTKEIKLIGLSFIIIAFIIDGLAGVELLITGLSIVILGYYVDTMKLTKFKGVS